MAGSLEHTRFEQVAQRVDPQSKLLRTWELKGGISARVTALELILGDGQTKRMVVRQHGEVDLKQNHHVAADEFKLLDILYSADLPTATPYYLDESGEIFPNPYVVVEYIDGQPELSPSHMPGFLCQLAAVLVKIHSVDISNQDLSFLPQQEHRHSAMIEARPANVDDALDERRIRDTLASVWPLPRRNASVLLHGDFWPGNILWKDGQLVSVIDWEDAAIGDPLADLGNARLEILWALGIDAMEEFTYRYASMMSAINFTDLPYWDLCADLRLVTRMSEWDVDDVTERTMRRRHHAFITQAFGMVPDK